MIKYTPSPKLARWLKKAPTGMKDELCTIAGTTPSMFRQWVSGRRNMSAEKAGRVEKAMLRLSEKYPTSPQPLSRGDLCTTCRNCSYFKDSSDIMNK